MEEFFIGDERKAQDLSAEDAKVFLSLYPSFIKKMLQLVKLKNDFKLNPEGVTDPDYIKISGNFLIIEEHDYYNKDQLQLYIPLRYFTCPIEEVEAELREIAQERELKVAREKEAALAAKKQSEQEQEQRERHQYEILKAKYEPKE